MTKKQSIVIFLFLLTHCNTAQKKVENQGRITGVTRYLSAVHGITIQHHARAVVLLQNGNCGACDISQIDFLYTLPSIKNSVIILQNNDTLLVQSMREKGLHNLLVDKHFALEKYGLSLTKSVYCEVVDDNVLFWSFLVEENYEKIRNKNALIIN